MLDFPRAMVVKTSLPEARAASPGATEDGAGLDTSVKGNGAERQWNYKGQARGQTVRDLTLEVRLQRPRGGQVPVPC